MQEQGRSSPTPEGGGRSMGKPEVPFEAFAALDLRIARVTSAEKHPQADRLVVIQVDLGEEQPRQLVAGLAEHYAPEDLVGRTIVVVANLKPVRLRGIESRGMLLAASGGGRVVLLTTMDATEPGWPVS
ncbi:MAG: methionine--tRNA ligase subunit beta [Candidatus Eisenbacteria bacterium]|nr:methionine--tRNA ligase subunit beta [Candidatus Eisenbacteria bacterium]